MDLFDLIKKDADSDTASVEETSAVRPLADRMRARNLSEFIGQEHIVSETSLLRRAIKMDALGSCIFWGPPGCGKTTLANVVALSTNGAFVKLNAVSSGVADVKKVVEEAKKRWLNDRKKTYLLLDECHRFSKTQSDSLLPAIENGTILFIGSTTENPYAAMTPAIVSRCRVFELKKLSLENVKKALIAALKDKKRGLGLYVTDVEEAALNHIALTADGDLRVAYNALEMAVLTTKPQGDGTIKVTLKDAEESIQRKALSYDENLYYDILSAFCKSLRGSDSNAALYYSQRLIQGGCEPMLIARRLVAHASEDVGLADPMAGVVATNAMVALEHMGVPEGLIPLSAAIIYVCEAPKSNSVIIALDGAREDAVNNKDDNVPPHLKNAPYGSDEDKKLSKKYKYPHDYGGYVKQQYLPDKLKNRVYYKPKDSGFEIEIKKRIAEREKDF